MADPQQPTPTLPRTDGEIRSFLAAFLYNAPTLRDMAVGLGACVILGLRYAQTGVLPMEDALVARATAKLALGGD